MTTTPATADWATAIEAAKDAAWDAAWRHSEKSNPFFAHDAEARDSAHDAAWDAARLIEEALEAAERSGTWDRSAFEAKTRRLAAKHGRSSFNRRRFEAAARAATDRANAILH